MRLPNPEKPSAQPGLLVVLIVLALVITTVWYREGVNGPVHKLRAGIETVTAPVTTIGEFITRPIRGVVAWATDLGVSRSQLETLRSQNAQLRTRVSELEEARLQNERLKGLVQFATASKIQSLGAAVIGRPTNSWEGVITINRGTADNVQAGMPVVGPSGLLGQTVDVAAHSARVRLITDPSSGVSAMLQTTRAEGIVKGSIEGKLTLDFVSVEATVRAGDVVITSGMGGVFPKGLIVGEVTKVVKSPAALYQHIELAPSGRVDTLEEVLVLTGVAATNTVGGGE